MQKTVNSKTVQKIKSSIPVFLLKELKKSHKPIYIRDNINQKDLQSVIAKDIKGIEKGFITDEKINNVYEGIIDIKWLEQEVVMFFKNSVDNSLITDMFLPYQIKSLNLINQKNDIDIIAMTFCKC